jgi:hypothetical protein
MLITQWSRVLEKLTGLQLVNKFPAFYGTRSFITAFTSARHLSLSWASSIQSITPHPTSWRSILILSSHLRLGLPSGSYPQVYPPKSCIVLKNLHGIITHKTEISKILVVLSSDCWFMKPYFVMIVVLCPCKGNSRNGRSALRRLNSIGKGLPQQAEVAQGGPGRLRPRIFLTFGTTRVVGHLYAPAPFTPGEIPVTCF